MQFTSLPRDLIEHILSKVPDAPLARFRSTSKRWNVMLSSESFVKKHSANAPKEEPLCITLINSRVHLVWINLHEPSVKVATHPFYLRDPLSNSSQVDIRHVFHCDGLLLCSTEDNRLVVWDPYSGETKWIKPRDRYKDSDCFALGFDNTSSCKQYKILRVDRQYILSIKIVYEVYDFTSDSWRVLGTATDWYIHDYRRLGISMKGNTYWVAIKMVRRGTEFILGFDFSKETFQCLPLPHHSPEPILALSVVKEEQLCLLGFALPYNLDVSLHELQVWVTTSTGSWNKSLAVIGMDASYKDMYGGMLSRTISFLADEQNKVIMSMDHNNILHILRENKHILEKHLGGGSRSRSSSPAVLMNYPPSLARIRQGSFLKEHKRKAESMCL